MNMIVEKLGEIKGTKDIINRLRVGRTLKEYEIESRRHGGHINDGGVGLLKEISKKYKADLPNKMKKAYEPTRPSGMEYSPTKSYTTFGNKDPVNIVTNFSPQTKSNLMRWSKSNSPLKQSSPDVTPKVNRMKRNISALGKNRNVTIDSVRSFKDASPA